MKIKGLPIICYIWGHDMKCFAIPWGLDIHCRRCGIPENWPSCGELDLKAKIQDLIWQLKKLWQK